MIHIEKQTRKSLSTHIGVFLYTLAVAGLAVMDAAAKKLTGSLPAGEILFFRALFGFVPIFLIYFIYWKRSSPVKFIPENWIVQILRGFSVAIVALSFFVAVQGMQLADATGIAMSGSIFIVVFGAVFLGERVTSDRWICVLVSFAGVLLIVQPGAAYVSWYAVAAFVSAVSYAISAIQTRRLMRTDSYLQISLWTTAVILATSLACTIVEDWTFPEANDWLPLIILGFMGGLSNMLFSLALGKSEVSLLAPLDYSIFVWALLFGFVFFAEFPTPLVCIGALMIIACGAYLASSSSRDLSSEEKSP